MKNTELLLKYTMIADSARTITSEADWDIYAGALERKPGDVYAITFINTHSADTTKVIVVNELPIVYNGVYTIAPPTPGGSVDIRSIKIRWPDGTANLSVILMRMTNYRFTPIDVNDN